MEAQSMSNKPIIAIADDNPVALEVLASNLDDRYEVRTFESGRTVLDVMASQHVDLLLLDVEMPGFTGYDTCRALRAGHVQQDVPVIFVSARVGLEDRLLGYAAGGNDYVTKPYDVDELEAKIILATTYRRKARQMADEVADLSQTALLTAEMMGEVGVVLEFQRALTDCTSPEEVASAVIATLGRFGLEGCTRLKTRRTTVSRSMTGPASALEASILDQLAALPDTRILTMGPNLGFTYGSVTLLVRCVAWATAPSAPETLDTMGRARDNVALLVEGAVARLRAIDTEQDARQLDGAKTLIALTRDALGDLESVEHELHRELNGVFETMSEEFEMRFPQLGLTAEQEDSLAGIVRRHRSRGLAVLERGRMAEVRLRGLIVQLETSSGTYSVS
jgi:DNA-binding response OmpR family regulator